MLKKILSRNKFRLTRGYTYISMFAMPLLIVDVINRRFPEIPFIPLFAFSILGVWIIGYIDDKLGLLSSEQSYSISRNTLLMKMLGDKNKSK